MPVAASTLRVCLAEVSRERRWSSAAVASAWMVCLTRSARISRVTPRRRAKTLIIAGMSSVMGPAAGPGMCVAPGWALLVRFSSAGPWWTGGHADLEITRGGGGLVR
jgi:hypothetical protein